MPNKIIDKYLDITQYKDMEKYVTQPALSFDIIDYRTINNNNIEKYWYLAAPYTGNPEERFNDASKMAALLHDNGYFVFSPVTHFHPISKFAEKDYYDLWIEKCLKFVKLSRGVIVCMMKGWEDSKGIAKEVKLAIDLGLPVVYCDYLEMPVING